MFPLMWVARKGHFVQQKKNGLYLSARSWIEVGAWRRRCCERLEGKLLTEFPSVFHPSSSGGTLHAGHTTDDDGDNDDDDDDDNDDHIQPLLVGCVCACVCVCVCVCVC